MVNTKLKDRKFRLKYGLFSSIGLMHQFIKRNPKNQRGKNSIQWIAHYMDTLLKYGSQCEHITEFGINQVNSTWAFLNARPQKLVSIDIDLNTRSTKNVKDFEGVNYWLLWAKYLSIKEQIEFQVIEADDLKIEIEETDLLFIDSKHEKKHFQSELDLHKSKIKKYLIVHDTGLFKDQLVPVIDELVKNKEFEIIEQFKDSPGLTVLKKIIQ